VRNTGSQREDWVRQRGEGSDESRRGAVVLEEALCGLDSLGPHEASGERTSPEPSDEVRNGGAKHRGCGAYGSVKEGQIGLSCRHGDQERLRREKERTRVKQGDGEEDQQSVGRTRPGDQPA
jgi:hypothetical protein